MKRSNGRAIIIDNDEVILMFRRKIFKNHIQEYYAIPGGGQELNETLEECTKREIKEELSLDVEIKELLGIVEDEKNIGHVFRACIIGGNLKLGGEELQHNSSENYYEIRKIKVTDIDKYDILKENKELIRKAYLASKKENKNE